jgi:hypothetical protein
MAANKVKKLSPGQRLRRDVFWVYKNLATNGKSSQCPSKGALAMLEEAKKHRWQFISMVLTKLMPPNSADEEASFKSPVRESIDLADRVLSEMEFAEKTNVAVKKPQLLPEVPSLPPVQPVDGRSLGAGEPQSVGADLFATPAADVRTGIKGRKNGEGGTASAVADALLRSLSQGREEEPALPQGAAPALRPGPEPGGFGAGDVPY